MSSNTGRGEVHERERTVKKMMLLTHRCRRHENEGAETQAVSTWGGLKWEAKDVWRVSELRDGGTLETSVLRRDTSTCGVLFSAAFGFP